MDKVFKYKKVILLIVTMVLITLSISGVSIWLIYQSTQKNVQLRLTDIVQRERFFALSILQDNPLEEFHILEHLNDSTTIGQYGEIVYFRQLNDSIEFLISPRNLNMVRLHQNLLAGTPYLYAFSKGKGFVKGTDYNGKKIYAAFTPVDSLPWGIVAKMPASEVNKPYIRAIAIVLVLTLALVSLASVILLKTTNPIIDNLLKNERLLLQAKESAESVGKNFRDIFNNSPVGIFVVDVHPDGSYVFNSLNPFSEIFTGIKNEEISGKSIDFIKEKLGPDIADYIRNLYDDIVHSRETKVFEESLEVQGRRINLNTSIRPLFDENGRVFRLIGTNLDISQLKQTQDELKIAKEKAEESQKQMIKAQKTSQTGNWIWYIPENRLWWSDEMYRIFDIDKETFSGDLSQVIMERIHPDDHQIVEEANKSVIHKNEPVGTEYRIVKQDGSITYVFALADEITLDEYGHSRMLTGIVKDITSFKLIELELTRAKEKAEESDRLKTAFVHNLSHEIRTPMNAIMGFSELMANNFNNKAKIEHFSRIINQRCNDLLVIIDDILDIAKIESGQLPVHMERVDVNALFEELRCFFAEHQSKISKQHIEFTLSANGDMDSLIIQSDKTKLKQILINLIGNSFKFTDHGYIRGGCRMESSSLVFYVSDSGIGIPEDKHELIFERFMQLAPASRKVYGGTGLGLSIVKGLVHLLGGTIWLESQEGKGSTFYFSLPCLIADKTENISQTAEKQSIRYFANSKTILVVEDDPFNASYINELLSESGINILNARNGREAVEIATTAELDLVLMDIGLPDISGYEATHLIRERKPGLRIIAQTAYAASDDRIRAMDAGCTDYISKPLRSKSFLAMVNRYLSD